jgi:hypothetical protein
VRGQALDHGRLEGTLETAVVDPDLGRFGKLDRLSGQNPGE